MVDVNTGGVMESDCTHSCKGLCTALAVAERRELEALGHYRKYAADCDYPDVRSLLERLVADRERSLATLRATREALNGRFSIIDTINDSFA
jgi:rubrerythrin